MRSTSVVIILFACCVLSAQTVSAGPAKVDVGATFVDALNRRDLPATMALIDTRELTKRIGSGAFDQALIPRFVETYFRIRETQFQTARLLRTTTRAGQTLAVVRLDAKAPGYDYLEVIFEPRPSGGYEAVDWYIFDRGELFSDFVSLNAKLAIGDPEILHALFGDMQFDDDLKGRIGCFATFLSAGQRKDALQAMGQLPIPIAQSRYVLLRGAELAGGVDQAAYQRIENTLISKYGNDPNVAFTLLGYYLAEKQTDALLRATLMVEQRVGPDVTMDIIRSEGLLHAGAYDAALWYAQEAVRVEPDSQFAWNRLASSYVQSKDYSRAVAIYRVIQGRFGTKFDRHGFEGDVRFADFVKSGPFDQWLPREGRSEGARNVVPASSPESAAASLVNAFKECDEHALGSLIDTGALAVRTAKLTHTALIQPLYQSSKDSLIRSLLLPSCGPEHATVKLVRSTARAGEKLALLRIVWPNLGFDYLEFVLEPDLTGQYRVVDWYQLSRGEMHSGYTVEMQRVLDAPDDTGTSHSELLDQLGRVETLHQEGHYADELGALSDLPGAVAGSRPFLLWRSQAALLANRKGEYERVLDIIAAQYGADPSLTISMIDYYLKENQFDKALERINAIEQRVGSDAFTDLLKAGVKSRSGAHDQAIALILHAVEIEPGLSPAWAALAREYVESKNYSRAVVTYQALEFRFGMRYTREGFFRDPDFAEFTQSQEFQRWLPQ